MGFDDSFCKKCHFKMMLCDCETNSTLTIHVSNTSIFDWVRSEVVLVRTASLREFHCLKVEEVVDVCEVRFICIS